MQGNVSVLYFCCCDLSAVCLICSVCVFTDSVSGMSATNKPAEDGGSFSSKVINIVFVILLLDLLGFTLILPLLPSILDHYAQTGVRRTQLSSAENFLSRQ